MTASPSAIASHRAVPHSAPAETLLRVRGLSASFRRPNLPPVRVLNDVDLEIRTGETLGIIGESASGKSTLALNILRLIDPRDLVIDAGEILWKGVDLLKVDLATMQRLRGAEISMVFQDPMTALDPLVPIQKQIAEVIRAHRVAAAADAEREALQLLERVGLSRAAAMRRPFELSGGQRQRALISMAVANKPQLIIADEPTTALDATVQAEVLDLLKELSREVGAAVLLITHDLGVIARMCDRVMVMYSGQMVETANVDMLFGNPRMPYTWSLLQSAPKTFEGPRVVARPIPGSPPTLDKPPSGCRFHPRCEHARQVCRETMPALRTIAAAHEARCHFADRPDWRWAGLSEAHVDSRSSSDDVVFELRGIRKVYGAGAKTVVAVDGVDMTLRRGEVLAIVGESGCGKTTLGKMMVRLIEPSAGSMLLCGETIDPKSAAQLRAYRRRVQMVFQDPYSSLNPRMRVIDAVAEPLLMSGIEKRVALERAAGLLERCGLPATLHRRFPHQFSGGQRQRVGIARALILSPEVVVLDEPVSALDVSIQAQILALLREMQRETDTSFVFISHDLAVVRQLSDRTAVMLGGRFVEVAPTDELFIRPQHDYTRKLLAAARVDISARTHP
jgi:peptide/nickel transport system ATP-binding protein